MGCPSMEWYQPALETDFGGFNSLAVNQHATDDNAYLAYVDSEQVVVGGVTRFNRWIKVTTFTPTHLVSDPLLESTETAVYVPYTDNENVLAVALDVDGNMNLHLAYWSWTMTGGTADPYIQKIRYYKRVNGVWGQVGLTQTFVDAARANFVDLTVDSQSVAHIALGRTLYDRDENDNLRIRSDVYYWQPESLVQAIQLNANVPGQIGSKQGVSIALANDLPTVAYAPAAGNNTLFFHYKNASGTWVGPNAIPNVYGSKSPMVYANGQFHLAYSRSEDEPAQLLTFSNVSWSVQDFVDSAYFNLAGLIYDEDSSGLGNDSGPAIFVIETDNSETIYSQELDGAQTRSLGEASASYDSKDYAWNPNTDERWLVNGSALSLYCELN